MGDILSTPSSNPSSSSATTLSSMSPPISPQPHISKPDTHESKSSIQESSDSQTVAQTAEIRENSEEKDSQLKRDSQTPIQKSSDQTVTAGIGTATEIPKEKDLEESIDERDIGDEGDEEEEEGECGFCLFMKGGGCKEPFIEWEKCVEEGERNKEDIVEKCFQATSALKKCMEAHSDYYAPILQAEKAAEEEAVYQLEEEKQRSNNQETELANKDKEETSVQKEES